MNTPIHAVIFDSDGTLVDTEDIGLDVIHTMAVAEGLRVHRDEVHQRFRGIRMADVVRWISSQLPHGNTDFEADFMARVRLETAQQFARGVRAMPGAHALLAALQVPFCIATNGPREKIEHTLLLSGLRPLLGERVFCAYEVGSFKPDPGLFLHAASALAQSPQHCAVVEDSLAGIEAGVAAGMQVFSLHPAQGIAQRLLDQITLISSLEELQVRWQHLCRRTNEAIRPGP